MQVLLLISDLIEPNIIENLCKSVEKLDYQKNCTITVIIEI